MMFQRFSLGFRTRECEGCSVAWVPLYSRNCLQALRISSLTAVGELLANVEVCVTIDASPDHHWPSVKRWSYHIVSFMCVKHVHSVKLLSSMKRAGYWCWMCQLCCLISAVWAARCGAQFPLKEIGFSCRAHGIWVWQFGQKTCRSQLQEVNFSGFLCSSSHSETVQRDTANCPELHYLCNLNELQVLSHTCNNKDTRKNQSGKMRRGQWSVVTTCTAIPFWAIVLLLPPQSLLFAPK